MRPLAASIPFLLLLSLSHALWVQNATILVRDLNGVPVPGAEVAISYQKSDPFSFGDGLATGKTGDDGIFSASMKNTVAQENSKDYVIVNASLPYWESGGQTLQVQPSGRIEQNFTIPYSLSPLIVLVESADGVPLTGASVYVLEAGARKETDANGTASFLLPFGMGFQGLAILGDSRKGFNSSSAIPNGAGRLSRAAMPIIINESFSAPAPILNFSLRVVDVNKSPFARQEVNLALPDGNATMETDSNGIVSVALNQSWNLTAQIELFAHVHRFYYELQPNPNGTLYQGRNETATILPLLNLTLLKPEEDFPNCFLVLANVTDQRTSLPLQVHFVLATSFQELNTTLEIPLPAAQAESGLYTTRRCIKSNATVTAYASNKYESAQKAVNLTYRQAAPPNQTKPITKPLAPQEPKQVTLEEALISLAAAIIVLGSLLAVILGRRYLGMLSRFMIEYLRLFIRILQGKKR